ncbi:MAG: nucleoside deaminase [Deltaproteobacteria bacterium]|nr:nucleoside deaminase [Deltaproteobacteria bacterium]
MKDDAHHTYMTEALHLARQAAAKGEVPVGAVIICNNKMIAGEFNTCESDCNPVNHAEIKAIVGAAHAKKNWRLNDCALYVTIEPCPMCLGALFQARMGTVYFGCCDHKRETDRLSVFPSLKGQQTLRDNNHCLSIHGGILEDECADLLRGFFKKKR